VNTSPTEGAGEDARIVMLDLDEARRRAAEVGVSDAAAQLSIFRLLLHQPQLAKWVHDLIMGLLWKSSFDPRLRELVIMRLGWATGSVYEWTQHWSIAVDWLGVDPDDLLAVRNWSASTRFGPAERAVLAAVDEVVADGFVSSGTWAACRAHVTADPVELIEMVSSIGTWRMVSSLLRSLDVPLEPGRDPWPPDGNAP